MFHNSKKETILKEEIQDNMLAIYLEDKQINYIPEKDSGYTLDITKSSCNNGVTISFDYNTWSVKTNYSNYKNNDNMRVKCSLYFTDKYIEPLLNGTDPVLEDPLIPVTISDDGTVRKADLASEWYDYETKQWANAVILEDESKNYASNEIIPEENIESYFVWIPKYRYQLWDLGLYDSLTTIDTNKVHEIPVIFGDYNTSDSVSGECTTPMESGESGNCQVGDYMTHPAFISIPSTGFWVGKFETGYKGATNVTEAEANIRDASKVQIKPNVYSWRSIQVANAFYTSYDYKRELDSHMMKNTEWGAVAYLSQSTYGFDKKISINNHSDYKTGFVTLVEPTCGYTGTNEECNYHCNDNSCNSSYPNSKSASTTGNNSGIFDLNGGTWEYVMLVMANEAGEVLWGNYHFNSSDIKSKYYDFYRYSAYLPNQDQYKNRILGDATGEMGPFYLHEYAITSTSRTVSSWYHSDARFLNSVSVSLSRGGSNWDGAGANINYFYAQYGFGEAHINGTFRLILTPTK